MYYDLINLKSKPCSVENHPSQTENHGLVEWVGFLGIPATRLRVPPKRCNCSTRFPLCFVGDCGRVGRCPLREIWKALERYRCKQDRRTSLMTLKGRLRLSSCELKS